MILGSDCAITRVIARRLIEGQIDIDRKGHGYCILGRGMYYTMYNQPSKQSFRRYEGIMIAVMINL